MKTINILCLGLLFSSTLISCDQVLSVAYNYDSGKVFFKPTLAYGPQTFRNTKEGALAYFIGENPN